MINNVVLVGRITKDPEIKYTSTGIATLAFTVAVDRGIKDNSGERQADFINCVAWRNNAEFLSRYVKKGYMIGVEGRIQTRSYQSQTDNQMRYVTEVVCESVTNLQPRDPNQPQAVNQNYQQNQPRQINNPSYQQNNGFNNYQANYQQQSYSPDSSFEKESFNVDVAEDDLPF